jgi:hypothetical protein
MKNLLIALIFSLLWACSKDDTLLANGELEGTYNVIIDPVRCASPSTNQVIITKMGVNYRVSYVPNSTKKLTFYDNVTAEKLGNEYKLTLNGREFGKYIKDTYRDIDGQKEGMVLYLQDTYFEFMGNK